MNNNINSKELKVIDSIYKNPHISQRDIARDIGRSLGLTNILVNRLIKEGYIKVSCLNAKKMKYIITPRGLREKAHKSYKFMKRSFSVINRLKGKITDFAFEKYTSGRRNFIILGSGELSDITELVLDSLKLENVKIMKIDKKTSFAVTASVVFNTAPEDNGFKDNQLNVWREAEKLYGSSYEI